MTDNPSNEGKRLCDGCDELWPADHRCTDEDSCPCRECLKRRMPPPRVAASKSEYKRLVAMGADVLPPLTPLEQAAVEWHSTKAAMMAHLGTDPLDADAYSAAVVAHMESTTRLEKAIQELLATREDGR